MEDRLNISKLKVLGYDFREGRECMEALKQNKQRRYALASPTALDIYTNQGTLQVRTSYGFQFDGRSGPWIVDWYVPNLGTLEEKMCWFVHDCNGYGLDLSFKDTNALLFAMLRDLAGYRPCKAAVIRYAVSLSKSWYGIPDESDWCHVNIGKVDTIWRGVVCSR